MKLHILITFLLFLWHLQAALSLLLKQRTDAEPSPNSAFTPVDRCQRLNQAKQTTYQLQCHGDDKTESVVLEETIDGRLLVKVRNYTRVNFITLSPCGLYARSF